MINKPGRNDPCWCGSGLKYKKCHLDREKQKPLEFWQAERELNKAFNIKDCLAPKPMKAECSKVLSKAHTVSKSGSLRKISRNGHVYSFIPGSICNGRLQPELLGINNASTFNGFCSKHDDIIFSKIEKQPFIASQEQCFLLSYRALSRELYLKNIIAQHYSNAIRQSDRGKPLDQQLHIQETISLYLKGTSQGLNDMEHYKTIYDNNLISGDFSDVRAYIIELDSPPQIMCSTGIAPEYDFKGNMLQSMINPNIIPHFLNFTSFCSGKHGIIAFTWLSENDIVCRLFIDSLKALQPDRVTDGLIRFFFEFSENLHIRPEWWENISNSNKEYLINKMNYSMHLSAPRKPDCIAEDGIKIDNWHILDTKTVGF